MLKILGIGNALVDVSVMIQDDSVLRKYNIHKGGMTLIDQETQIRLENEMKPMNPHTTTGGSTSNAMLALACMGARPTYVGRIGSDRLGHFFKETGTRMGINERLIVCNEHTGVANTFISADGERSFGTHLGAALGLGAEDITDGLFADSDLVHVEGYLVQNSDLMEKICKTAKRNGLLLSLDLGSWNIVKENRGLFRRLIIEYCDIVFANEEEARALSCMENPVESLEYIASMADTAIVKLGRHGASAMKKGEKRIAVPAGNVANVIDTTAAGDFFTAGFLYAYANGASLEKCLMLGSKLSEKIIQTVGTRLRDEAWKEIRSYAQELLP